MRKLKGYGSNSATSLVSGKKSSTDNTFDNNTNEGGDQKNLTLAKIKQNSISKYMKESTLKTNEYLYTANSDGKLMKWGAKYNQFGKIIEYEQNTC